LYRFYSDLQPIKIFFFALNPLIFNGFSLSDKKISKNMEKIVDVF